MGGKIAGLGCLALFVFSVVVAVIGGYAESHGFTARAPLKKFVVIDRLPEPDPKCVTRRERKETLAHTAWRLGWPVPGGVKGSGYYEVVTPPPWPCELQQEWLRNPSPIPEGTALEVQGEDAISAVVTGFAGEARRVMLNHHNNSRDFDPNHRNDEMPLLGYHFVWIPWNSATNAPACLARWSAVGFMDWPPEGPAFIYLLFFIILGLKIFDCIGKGNFTWLWSLLLYVALFAPILYTVSAFADSRTQCEPRAIEFVQNVLHDGMIYPFTANALQNGPWIADSSIVLASQVCFFLAIILAARLLWPAYVGLHYLSVPHPAEGHVRRRPGKLSEINVSGFADSLGKENGTNPPPDFVLKNKTRRIRNLADLFRAEREAAEEAVRHQRATRPNEKK